MGIDEKCPKASVGEEGAVVMATSARGIDPVHSGFFDGWAYGEPKGEGGLLRPLPVADSGCVVQGGKCSSGMFRYPSVLDALKIT